MSRQRVFELVKKALEDLNEELEYDTLRSVSDDTPVFGGDDGIDSLSLVRLVVGLEGAVEKAFGTKVLLSDEKAMSQRNSPYRSAGTLTDFIQSRLEGARA